MADIKALMIGALAALRKWGGENPTVSTDFEPEWVKIRAKTTRMPEA